MAKRTASVIFVIVALLLLLAPARTDALPGCNSCWHHTSLKWCEDMQCYVEVQDDLCMPDYDFNFMVCRLNWWPEDCDFWSRECTLYPNSNCDPFGWS